MPDVSASCTHKSASSGGGIPYGRGRSKARLERQVSHAVDRRASKAAYPKALQPVFETAREEIQSFEGVSEATAWQGRSLALDTRLQGSWRSPRERHRCSRRPRLRLPSSPIPRALQLCIPLTLDADRVSPHEAVQEAHPRRRGLLRPLSRRHLVADMGRPLQDRLGRSSRPGSAHWLLLGMRSRSRRNRHPATDVCGSSPPLADMPPSGPPVWATLSPCFAAKDCRAWRIGMPGMDAAVFTRPLGLRGVLAAAVVLVATAGMRRERSRARSRCRGAEPGWARPKSASAFSIVRPDANWWTSTPIRSREGTDPRLESRTPHQRRSPAHAGQGLRVPHRTRPRSQPSIVKGAGDPAFADPELLDKMRLSVDDFIDRLVQSVAPPPGRVRLRSHRGRPGL